MADNVVFEDYSIRVMNAISEHINIALEEGAGEMESAVKRNQDRYKDTGDTTNSWTHKVVESEHKAYIGSPLMNAIWEEFGTGEHAADGKGRAGYWVFVKGSGESEVSKPTKAYTLEEAKRIMAIMRSKGLEAYYTNGKRPRRHLEKAFNDKKEKIKKIIQKRLKELG